MNEKIPKTKKKARGAAERLFAEAHRGVDGAVAEDGEVESGRERLVVRARRLRRFARRTTVCEDLQRQLVLVLDLGSRTCLKKGSKA